MRTFNILSFIVFFAFTGTLRATTVSPQDSTFVPKSLAESIARTPLSRYLPNVALNTRMAFHSALSGDRTEANTFRVDYLRLQVTGNITDRISYKWMQHINRSNQPRGLDNTPSSIDCLGVGFKITPTLSTFIGKQYADFGGFEYDADPAQVYEFSDFGDNITCFLVGANLVWEMTPTQELRVQVVDGRSDYASETYSSPMAEFKAAKTPLGYTLNWNGSFLKERLLTRCSFSVFHEGESENVYFLSLGASWTQKRFNIYVDGMYSWENIDKLGILSNTLAGESFRNLADAGYLTLVSRANYRILPKWNLFVKGMYETASLRKENPGFADGKYRTSIGYQGGVEFYPMKENLHFYVICHGHRREYTHLAKGYGLEQEKDLNLSIGFIYKIPIF